ncbi:MAG: hypothetical protein JO069_14145 [Verrucomicrobia bacterium]|nr:hypothetical protein [Verrucomicrobiota bacterium]
MLKIQRSRGKEGTVFALSGRIEAADLPQLESLAADETSRVIFDLGEVNLAGREAILFLSRCEARGVRLENCPGFIREWIAREKGGT